MRCAECIFGAIKKVQNSIFNVLSVSQWLLVQLFVGGMIGYLLLTYPSLKWAHFFMFSTTSWGTLPAASLGACQPTILYVFSPILALTWSPLLILEFYHIGCHAVWHRVTSEIFAAVWAVPLPISYMAAVKQKLQWTCFNISGGIFYLWLKLLLNDSSLWYETEQTDHILCIFLPSAAPYCTATQVTQPSSRFYQHCWGHWLWPTMVSLLIFSVNSMLWLIKVAEQKDNKKVMKLVYPCPVQWLMLCFSSLYFFIRSHNMTIWLLPNPFTVLNLFPSFWYDCDYLVMETWTFYETYFDQDNDWF